MNTKNRRAVSPVIATVILVAVAITITIAVAYWMGGIAGGYTKFEKVEVSSMVCSALDANKVWEITAKLKNSGSASATLTTIYVNQWEVPLGGTTKLLGGTNATLSNMANPKTMDPGQEVVVKVWIEYGFPPNTAASAYYTSGTTLNIKFHSAGGMDYIKIVELV